MQVGTPALTQKDDMPLYKYKCPECDAIRDDVLQRFDDAAIECDCGVTMERQICLPGLVKGFNYDIRTQSAEENMIVCGVDI